MSARKENDTAMQTKDEKKSAHETAEKAEHKGNYAESNIMIKSDFPQETERLLGDCSGVVLKLRNYYDTLQQESVPSRFLDLLAQLEKAELSDEKQIANLSVRDQEEKQDE